MKQFPGTFTLYTQFTFDAQLHGRYRPMAVNKKAENKCTAEMTGTTLSANKSISKLGGDIKSGNTCAPVYR